MSLLEVRSNCEVFPRSSGPSEMSLENHACFSPIVVRGVTIPNRIAMAPMTRRCAAADGSPSPAMAAYYARRAQSGVGLIIVEGVHVNSNDAVDRPNTPQCSSAEHVRCWKELVRQCKEQSNGRVVMCMQLWHTGMSSQDPIGPVGGSVQPASKKIVRSATRLDIERISGDFARTAHIAIHDCGFDSVEIHGAHGYFVDSFASPTLNTRVDEFGGDRQRRCAVASKVVREVRAAVGPKAPILFRFSQWTVSDYRHIKFVTSADLAVFVEALLNAGVDVLDASTRRLLDPAFPAEHPTRSLAEWTKIICGDRAVVAAVGSVSVVRALYEDVPVDSFNLSDPYSALNGIAAKYYDLVQVGRGLIADSEWVEKVRSGRWRELKSYSTNSLKSLL